MSPRFLVHRSLGVGGCSTKITEDVRKNAAEQGVSEEEALKKGMEEKSKEFVEKGAEVYAKARESHSCCHRNVTRVNFRSDKQNMPKTRELIELFRAIGSHDLAQAAALSRKLAAQHGSRGQYRAERDLLGALNGMAKPPSNGHGVAPNTAWSVSGTLMPLVASKPLPALELSPAVRGSF